MQQITITIHATATASSYTITRQYNKHARREETGILTQASAEHHLAALRKLAHAIAAAGRSNPQPTKPHPADPSRTAPEDQTNPQSKSQSQS